MTGTQLTPEQNQQLQEARKRAIDSTNILNESSQDIREGRIDIFDQIARYSGGTASVMFTFLGVLIGLKNGQAQVEASDQSVLKFEPMIHLVTAAYAKNENGTTSGLSIALIVNQDGSVDLPRDHFLNAELLDYFDENHPVNWRSVECDLPSKLHGYHLVAGSVEVQEILPRELEAMSF